jgi:hypothetical protein
MVSKAQKLELFWKGKPAANEILINDSLMSELVHDVIYKLPPESIESQKFSQEWTDLKFEEIAWFYYSLIAAYVPFLFSQIQLILYDYNEGDGYEYFVYIFWMTEFTIVSLVQETIQVISEGKKYFLDPSNLVESLQIVLNTVFIALKLLG